MANRGCSLPPRIFWNSGIGALGLSALSGIRARARSGWRGMRVPTSAPMYPWIPHWPILDPSIGISDLPRWTGLLRSDDPPTAFVLASNAGNAGHSRGHSARGSGGAGQYIGGRFRRPVWYAQWGESGITTIGMSLQDLAEAAASQLMRQLQPGDANENAPMHIALENLLSTAWNDRTL